MQLALKHAINITAARQKIGGGFYRTEGMISGGYLELENLKLCAVSVLQ